MGDKGNFGTTPSRARRIRELLCLCWRSRQRPWLRWVCPVTRATRTARSCPLLHAAARHWPCEQARSGHLTGVSKGSVARQQQDVWDAGRGECVEVGGGCLQSGYAGAPQCCPSPVLFFPIVMAWNGIQVLCTPLHPHHEVVQGSAQCVDHIRFPDLERFWAGLGSWGMGSVPSRGGRGYQTPRNRLPDTLPVERLDLREPRGVPGRSTSGMPNPGLLLHLGRAPHAHARRRCEPGRP